MHVTDVMPTLLDMAGVPRLDTSHGQPARAFDGMSCAQVLLEGAPSPRIEQYYECWSNRAYYRNGWLARSLQIRDTPIDMENWTLHNLAEDFSESTDLAARHPDKLKELVEAFDAAAWKYFVYPLDNRGRPGKFSDVPAWARERANHPRRFLPGSQTAHRSDVFPLVGNRAFRIRVRFAQRAGDEGVLWSLGDTIAGMVMYVEANRLNFHYNGFGEPANFAPVNLGPGAHEAMLEYEALGQRRGRGRLLLDGAECIAWSELSPTLMLGPFEGLDVGLDRRAPVFWELYERHGAYPYGGRIEDVWIDPGLRAMA
jgi:arylsulfatase